MSADWPGVSAQDFAVLRVDPSRAELWIIAEGASRGRVLEYHAFTLARVRDLVLPAINGAAALGGHLYVTSGARLIDVAPHAAPRTVAVVHTRGGLGPVAADPSADRLIILDYGFPTLVRTYRPAGG
ncbi:MAG TPA: hypothetical protein VFU35_09585, partial [Jatrophihabitans sp.]|nr:hypothetical protein [Jatrophihabitans sp.]